MILNDEAVSDSYIKREKVIYWVVMGFNCLFPLVEVFLLISFNNIVLMDSDLAPDWMNLATIVVVDGMLLC